MKKMLVVSVIVMLATVLVNALSLAQAEGGKIRLVTREISLGRVHPSIVGESLYASLDSQRVAYRAEHGNKQFVVMDGEEGKEYDEAGPPLFSPNSQRVAYGAARGGKQFVVVDGMEGKEYDGIRVRTLRFNPDGQRMAYVAVHGDKRFLVVNGGEGKEYDEMGPPLFSPE